MQRLNYRLNKHQNMPLYLQLYQQIRDEIHSQQRKLGEKLPSKRELSGFLQISQNTVENAYAQLLAEGYIESLPKRGYFVCFQAELGYLTRQNVAKDEVYLKKSTPVLVDFNPNLVDSQAFPFDRWKKAARYLYSTRYGQWINLGNKVGDDVLREQIVDYLQASRGVCCETSQVVIGAGVESCLQQLILLFNRLYPNQAFTYAMEYYGYQTVEHLLQLYGKNVVKFPIETGNYQIDIEMLVRENVNVAYLTPSHLYPFGQVLSVSQRQRLIEWANATSDRYIIEDDYDSEFRYKGRPIPAMQSLDFQGKVIYLGSFSKLIMPSLRLTFMVLPKQLMNVHQDICGFINSSVSRFEQQRLAYFIQQGELEKHIHRMRKIYRRKMELICHLLDPYKDKICYYGEHSGFYLLVEVLKTSQNITALFHQALDNQIKVYPIDYQQRCLFILGFGGLSEEQISLAVEKLLVLWQIK